ncbi:MAG: YbhB/YbcL family Raf kinase inhibitor-like protein [Patescibacteria group bacterium]
MSARYIFVMVGVVALLGGMIVAVTMALKIMNNIRKSNNTTIASQIIQKNMQLTSSAFDHNGLMPAKYTCDGENINPPLKIFNVPVEAESLVLIVDDSDASAGDWVHWTVWNIAPDTSEIAENSIPVGATLGMTDFVSQGYGGPCPPSGIHRYQFKLYALDKILEIGADSDKADIEAVMDGHILEQALLTGRYHRQ